MKNIHLSYTIIFVVLLTWSCTKVDQIIYDAPTPTSAIKTQADIDNAICGIYSKLNAWDCFKEQSFTTIPYADDLSSTATNNTGIWAARIGVNAGVSNTLNVWRAFFTCISNANAVLGYIETTKISDVYKTKARAEAKFLRGLAYFYLVQYYGGVPITTTVFNGSTDLNPSRASVDSVYKLILSDLKEATIGLPTRLVQPSTEFNRATQGSAYGYLAKANLTYANYLSLNNRSSESTKYYTDAKASADFIINSGQYSLIADYSKLWDVTQEKTAYTEVMFGIAYTRDAVTTNVVSEGSGWAAFYNPSSRPNVSGNGALKTGNGTYKVQPWFYERYTTGEYVNDYRVETSFLTSWNNTSAKLSIAFPFVPAVGVVIGATESQPYVNKYTDPNGVALQSNENDLFLLRFSEMYLIKAEAENELNGPTAEAFTAFNAVRARARKANGVARSAPADLTLTVAPTKQAFRMKIFDERGLEFVGEFNRWFDLVRMSAADDKTTMYEYQYATYLPTLVAGLPTYNATTRTWSNGRTEKTNVVPFDKKYLLFPIPTNELSVNNKMTQNPGW
jgi:hypothetical protein